MSGQRSRQGFCFSDLVVAHRALSYLALKRKAEIEGGPPPAGLEFLVESPASGDVAPTWDVVERRSAQGASIIIDEIKSGPLTKDDRYVLWTRIRRTVAAMDRDGTQAIVPKLTTNAEEPTDNPDYWRVLPKLAQTAIGIPDVRVNSASALASEAIYQLTNAPLGEDRLTLARARQVLAVFDFADNLGFDSAKTDLDRLLDIFTVEFASSELRRRLLGELYERASSQDPVRRRFTAEELASGNAVLERLSRTLPEDAHIWRGWSKVTQAPTLTHTSSRGLGYQDWREIQPEIARSIDESTSDVFAVIGRGGLGKTVLLARLSDSSRDNGSRTIWIEGRLLQGVQPDRVRGALALGVFITAIEKRTLCVFVDAFEDGSESVPGRQALLAAFEANARTDICRIYISARSDVWNRLAGTQESMARCMILPLQDWDVVRVRQLSRESLRPSMSPEFVKLLQTPLLLDIFLRTFGPNESVPSGLQTRHGILRTYFERRVLPTERFEAASRRVTLTQVAGEEVRGISEHVTDSESMQQLGSEGVFIQQLGAWVFRHSLLRDFVVMLWAREEGRDSSGIADQLASISSTLVRWGALRAMMEAAMDPRPGSIVSPGVDSIIDALESRSDNLQLVAAEILGEADDPARVDVSRLLNTFADHGHAAAFLNRMLSLATLSENAGWLGWLSSLPAQVEWPDTTAWVGSEFLNKVTRFLEVVHNSVDKENVVPQVFVQVAIRLRIWSEAEKFRGFVSGGEGYEWLPMMKLVARLDPSPETLEWISRNSVVGMMSRTGALEALPKLLVASRAAGVAIDLNRVADGYVRAAGFLRNAIGLRQDPRAPSGSVVELHRTQIALLGYDADQHGHRGLVREAPEHFLAIAFEILSGFAADESARRTEEWSKWRLEQSDSLPLEITPEPLELEHQIRSKIGASLDPESALAGLYDDLSASSYRQTYDEREYILNALENWVDDDISEGGRFVEEVYWPVARRSRSATAWVLLLDHLCNRELSKVEVVDDILGRSGLYHVPKAHSYVADAIRKRWPSWDSEQRQRVLQQIEDTARSPVMNGLYAVAPLLDAIPVSDRPARLGDFFELYRLQGSVPRLEHSQPPDFSWMTFEQDNGKEQQQAPSPWDRIRHWRPGGQPVSSDASIVTAIRDLTDLIDSGLPKALELREGAEAISWISKILGVVVRRHHAPGVHLEVDLDRNVMTRLFEWTLDVARHHPPIEINGDTRPVTMTRLPPAGSSHTWLLAIELGSRALAHNTLASDPSARQNLVEEIRRSALSASPSLAWHIFSKLHHSFWQRSGECGVSTLREMLSILRDPGAAAQSFEHTTVLGLEESAALIRSWLTASESLDPTDEPEEFVRRAGYFLGGMSFNQLGGKRNPLRALVDELLASPPTTGLLGDRSCFLKWAHGVTLVAKDQFLKRSKSAAPVAPEAMVDLLTSLWLRVGPEVEDGNGSFIVLACEMLKVEGAWTAFEPLARRIITDGGPPMVYWLIWQLHQVDVVAFVGVQRVMRVVESLHTRVSQLDENALKRPSPSGHGWFSVLNEAAEMIGEIALAPDASGLRDRLFAILQVWSALEIEKAVQIARKIRDR